MRILELPWLKRRQADLAGVYLSPSAVALVVHQPENSDAAGGLQCQASPRQEEGQLTDLLRAQKATLGLARTDCCLVLAPAFYTLSLIERPDVSGSELKDAVRWKIQEYIDFPADEAVIDVFPLPLAASRGRAPMVFVVAAQRSKLKSLVDAVAGAGLNPICIDITELSLRTLAEDLFPEPDAAIGVLRITANTGMINITRGDELFLSRRITGIPGAFDEASWDTFKDMMLLQVQRSIDYYESALSQGSAQVLMVAATHEWQSRIVDYLAEMLPLPVRSLPEFLCENYTIDLYNPRSRQLAATELGNEEKQALAAAIPAFGGAIRSTRFLANSRQPSNRNSDVVGGSV